MAKYTQEQIDQVRNADPKEVAQLLGERIGMDAAAVSYYRCKFRKEAGGGKSQRKSPPSTPVATSEPMTPKQVIRMADPTTRSDFYESLRGAKKPCWFIRRGYQGDKVSAICASPRAAWADAAERFFKQFPKLRGTAR